MAEDTFTVPNVTTLNEESDKESSAALNSSTLSSNLLNSHENTSNHIENNNSVKVTPTSDSYAAMHKAFSADDLSSSRILQQELITVTLHLSTSNCIIDPHDTTSAERTDLVRVMLIPVSGLEQREQEMIQTARALQIPSSRWNGSLLYNLYHEQKSKDAELRTTTTSPTNVVPQTSTDSSGATTKIVLHLQQDSDMKWIASKNGSKTIRDTISSSATSWFGTCIHKNIDFDWIQTYYVTGRITIPSSARGYDVLWLLEFFQLMYQPDQFHFANYATYTRVQLWSKYYCYLRPMLIDWILNEIKQLQEQDTETTFPIMFGTTSSLETSMELGTERLMPLGDTSDSAVHQKYITFGSSKRTLADRAFKLFNSKACIEAINARTSNDQENVRSGTDEAHSQTTVPCQEERTTTEIRHDFCRYLNCRLSEGKNQSWNIQFTVRPITVHYNEESKVPDDNNGANSNSSSSSLPVTSDSIGTNTTSKSKCKKVIPRYMVAHRAVLMIDVQDSKGVSESDDLSPKHDVRTLKENDLKSDLNVPLEELVEEEIAKGRLEELFQKGDTRTLKPNVNKDERRVTINEIISFEKERRTRFVEESKSNDMPAESSLKKNEHIDLNVPHDELNASMDVSINASIGIFQSSPTTKKKKKPKPVFVLPDKLLDGDDNDQVVKDLERMKTPIVKSTPIVGSKNNDGLSLPGPITIVRKGTFDNTVTSALTGPFYVDENGILRDVFENCDEDSDEDYEGHEDTRAQARRHEWIQTALLNRGITERMEILLKEDVEPTTNATTTSFDPWDWFTGLNVCELSRDVIRSVENYANCVICEGSTAANAEPTTDDVVDTSPKLQDVSPSTQTGMKAAEVDSHEVEPISNCIRPTISNTLDEQSRDEEPFEHIIENIILATEMDNREQSFGSQESPRGVQRFDSVSSADKLTTQPSSDVTDVPLSQSGTDETRTTKTIPEKKIRGIKSLFRRKRIDNNIITKKNDPVSK